MIYNHDVIETLHILGQKDYDLAERMFYNFFKKEKAAPDGATYANIFFTRAEIDKIILESNQWNNPVSAIKYIRQSKDIGLKEAKDAWDALKTAEFKIDYEQKYRDLADQIGHIVNDIAPDSVKVYRLQNLIRR